MPNWTDDEGKSWFNRCEECSEMKNKDFKCVNLNCVESYEPTSEEEAAEFQEDCSSILNFFSRY